MSMHWPQVVWLVLAGLGIGIGLAQHGTPKTGRHNIVVDVLSVGIGLLLLYCGGFFHGGCAP